MLWQWFRFRRSVCARIGRSEIRASGGIVEHDLAPSHRARIFFAYDNVVPFLAQFLDCFCLTRDSIKGGSDGSVVPAIVNRGASSAA